MSCLIASYLSSTAPTQLYTLVRRVLTALLHHVQKPEQFSTVIDPLLNDFQAAIQSEPDDEHGSERRCRMMNVLLVPVAVRQGSRLTRTSYTLF